jgi:hypothetical protein
LILVSLAVKSSGQSPSSSRVHTSKPTTLADLSLKLHPLPPSSANIEHRPRKSLVTTEELIQAFDQAAALRRNAIGMLATEEGGGQGKRRKVAGGGRLFHPTIGIGNVGKRGGSDMPGGITVSMVDLCDYILRHGGWERVRSALQSQLLE